MRRFNLAAIILAFMLCVSAAAPAESKAEESVLSELWNSGCDLLFDTHNVSVTGEATFSLDGELFKTAGLHYVQDGFNSFYGLTLLTPDEYEGELKTGWTIIAGDDGYHYVMEAYEPGFYRVGSDGPENTLLRRTVRLDALADLGGLIVAQAAPLLPEGTVTTAEADGRKTVHIAVTENQIPKVALSALNLAAGYLSDRWFAFGYDRSKREDESASFDHYVTVTQALTDGTVRWILRSADVVFSLDAQGRLASAEGTVQAASVFWDESVREVEVSFSLAMSDYGTSRVKPFDPDDYHVEIAE